MLQSYNQAFDIETFHSCLKNLNFEFVNKQKSIITYSDKFEISKGFQIALNNSIFRSFLEDNINYAISNFNKSFNIQSVRDGFILYKKYTRKDVCRILNWDKNYESTVYGYKIHKNNAPLFVTYKKSKNISSTINYNDHFIDPSLFAWESKSNRTLKSKEIISIRNANSSNLRLLLFIQKNNDEGTDFYYMGDVSVIEREIKQDVKIDIKNNKEVPVVHFQFNLKDPVTDSIYNYLTSYSETSKIEKETEIIHLKEVVFQIPLLNFYAAAGTFSEIQSDNSYSMVEVPEQYSKDGYFACEIRGNSMNRRIPNGSICIFKTYSGGSRNGKIVLVENRDFQDPDFNSAFTVKTFISEKTISNDSWRHKSIRLKPNSLDSSYKDIVILEENFENMRIVGEFISIL